jgi:hypothetical protein
LTFLKSEIRRARREQEASMQTFLNENDSEAWAHIAPLLDAALADLNETDRNAVVLRFFYGKSLGEIGTTLDANEDAARMRVNRALEKLRQFFVKRGIASTTATLAGAISANSVQAAPVALAKSVTAVAIAKGALKIMAWTKAKTAIVAGVVILLAAGTTTVIVKNSHHHLGVKLQWTPAEKQMFEAETGRRINQSKQWALACIMFAHDHQSQLPKNFEQMNTYVRDLSSSNWEIVSGGNLNGFPDISKTILLQEKEPRPSPEGKFLRIYALADGSVQLVTSPDEDFAASQKKFGYVVHK